MSDSGATEGVAGGTSAQWACASIDHADSSGGVSDPGGGGVGEGGGDCRAGGRQRV